MNGRIPGRRISRLTLVGWVVAFHLGTACNRAAESTETLETIRLPAARIQGQMSVEEAIQRRRSVRSYSTDPLGLETVSQLLWSGAGKTGDRDHQRAAPSAGGLHPLDFYVVVGEGRVEGLQAGVWRYHALDHSLSLGVRGDRRESLKMASLNQGMVEQASINIVVTIEFERTTRKYKERGRRYAYMDCGFACENIFLQAESVGLAMCPIGAFDDKRVSEVLGLPKEHEPALILAIGYPR